MENENDPSNSRPKRGRRSSHPPDDDGSDNSSESVARKWSMDLHGRLKNIVNEMCSLIDQLTILISECNLDDNLEPGFTDNQYIDADARKRAYLYNLVALRVALQLETGGWPLYNHLKNMCLNADVYTQIKNRRDSYITKYLANKWNEWIEYKQDDELIHSWPKLCWYILNPTNKRVVWGYVETVVALLGSEQFRDEILLDTN